MKVTPQNKKTFFIRIILPTGLAILLFVASIFMVIIPGMEKNILDRKREMIKELTNSAWSVLAEFELDEQNGILNREEAKKQAISRIEYLRYGSERKDYFWITDMVPNMVMHPYRAELNGQDVSNYKDPEGKQLFVEFVNVVKNNEDGYVDYMWQWKDDSTRIVPKLSYVKEFKPWGWVIGTGIYIEDVKEEIAAMSSRLINISLAISVLIALLLFYITRQSFKIEHQRQIAEEGLKESEEKYRNLVEAATEGLIMALDGKYTYCNRTMLDMLGYEEQEFNNLDIYDIFYKTQNEKTPGFQYFTSLMNGNEAPTQFEAKLKRKDNEPLDAVLTISKIEFGGKNGFTIIVKDISQHKEIEEALGESKEKYKALTNNLNIGVFRTTLGKNGIFTEANPAAASILGYEKPEDLFNVNISKVFNDSDARHVFIKHLLKEGYVKNSPIEIKKRDGSAVITAVSAILIKNEAGEAKFCDGIVEDITEQKSIEKQRENLITELQASSHFMNQPIKPYLRKNLSCEMNTPVKKAAALMTKEKYSAILVASEKGSFIGIVTDHDLRERVVAKNIDIHSPVYQIMSSPVYSIDEQALMFEASLLMHEKSTRHLAVKDNKGEIISMISNEELLQVQRHSSSLLISEIQTAESVEDIIESNKRLPGLIKALMDSGAKQENITRIITSVSDVITDKLITFALEELGPAPVKFAFVALGSVGRGEQTLKTDQDNAIIFEDVPESKEKEIQSYFIKLGEKVCGWLNQSGYAFCIGKVMAQNPRWCQPLKVWKNYFYQWIITADPEDLRDSNIFFDFRKLYGDKHLTKGLKKHLNKSLDGKAAFFQILASNVLLQKPPIGMFGKIVVESVDGQAETFNIKHAIRPIVDFARIYALKNNLDETNTLERLNQLLAINALNKTSHDEIYQSYNYLMQLRFKHQVMAITNNQNPDNNINPKKITHLEQTILKKAFSQISDFQSRLKFDFTGTA